MKKLSPFISSLGLALLLLISSACSRSGSDVLFPANVMDESRTDLSAKLEYLGIPSPLSALDSLEVSPEERNALEFIYAYMITPDMLDYSVDFHLQNVRQTLRARNEMPWGKSVPANLWRHFVLPLRVGNEALDSARLVLYDELKKEVEGLSMYDAVLALNHWCHRYVTYAPSDGRTSSPLATMRNTLGRCGEESVFTVAVLRTMGIPARQVYTPRWAHTDDNHAWVEAYVDGTWHYLGACEPAPQLDNAWFDAPVKRAMLLHAKAFGRYRGSEETLSEHPSYTEINVTSNYVPTAVAQVRVVDAHGQPVAGVPVTFRLYNYAELYPLVTRTSDAQGLASAELGLGDIVVLAGNSPDQLGILHYTVTPEQTVGEVTLRPYTEWDDELHYRLVPPAERPATTSIDSIALATCQQQMAINDSIRTARFLPSATDAQALAQQLGITATPDLTALIIESRGNYETLKAFLSELNSSDIPQAVALLKSLSSKDLHDVTLPVLRDAFEAAQGQTDPWLISPRVERETLYPISQELHEIIHSLVHEQGDHGTWDALSRAERANIITAAVARCKVDERYNPVRVPLNPTTVWREGVGDRTSLRVLLVRLLRTAGIPALWDPAPDKVVYRNEAGEKVIIPFLEAEDADAPRADCALNLSYTPSNHLKTPKYENHFTIGYIDPTGAMGTYGFEYAAPYTSISGERLIHAHNFVAAGTRLADGTVLFSMKKVRCGEPTPLLIDHDDSSVSVIGSMNPEALYFDLSAGAEKTILSTTGRGYFVLVIGDAHHEPTDHILRDMQVLYNGETPEIPVIAMTRGNATPSPTLQALLPQASWGRDTHDIASELLRGCQIETPLTAPLVAVCDTFGRVVYLSQGYSIGIGGRIASVISAVK